jgi:hypothetical protein
MATMAAWQSWPGELFKFFAWFVEPFLQNEDWLECNSKWLNFYDEIIDYLRRQQKRNNTESLAHVQLCLVSYENEPLLFYPALAWLSLQCFVSISSSGLQPLQVYVWRRNIYLFFNS